MTERSTLVLTPHKHTAPPSSAITSTPLYCGQRLSATVTVAPGPSPSIHA